MIIKNRLSIIILYIIISNTILAMDKDPHEDFLRISQYQLIALADSTFLDYSKVAQVCHDINSIKTLIIHDLFDYRANIIIPLGKNSIDLPKKINSDLIASISKSSNEIFILNIKLAAVTGMLYFPLRIGIIKKILHTSEKEIVAWCTINDNALIKNYFVTWNLKTGQVSNTILLCTASQTSPEINIFLFGNKLLIWQDSNCLYTLNISSDNLKLSKVIHLPTTFAATGLINFKLLKLINVNVDQIAMVCRPIIDTLNGPNQLACCLFLIHLKTNETKYITDFRCDGNIIAVNEHILAYVFDGNLHLLDCDNFELCEIKYLAKFKQLHEIKYSTILASASICPGPMTYTYKNLSYIKENLSQTSKFF